ncbi:MAG: RNA pseudouridine synthase [Prevotellaceae bacterium]|jgi:tRNA pseudouridine32 synthase/23S rRNA pseudouridine746 synthase|nr:RNA pseudouridine synthase [Prevotellaceae bacterium]
MFHPLIPYPLPLPQRFTNPFGYRPHPLCLRAAGELQRFLTGQRAWHDELQRGKMFGVLVVENREGIVGFLAAFSGTLQGSNTHPYFVPPVYDLLRPEGFFRTEEAEISALNRHIQALEADENYRRAQAGLHEACTRARAELDALKLELQIAKRRRHEQRRQPLTPDGQAALDDESRHLRASYKRTEQQQRARLAEQQARFEELHAPIEALKQLRKERSARLQRRLFEQFRFLNFQGEAKDLCRLFDEATHRLPPAGAGECAAPRLLQEAARQGWKPLAMAEFWWGDSPVGELRRHGYFYPACKGKCEPILAHMLGGLELEAPVVGGSTQAAEPPAILYEDAHLLVVCKPAGMLSVPGRGGAESLTGYLQRTHPALHSLLPVHRLDMDTSGLLVLAKSPQVHRLLQRQFARHQVEKRYVALLEGAPEQDEGEVALPLASDWLDRPRQRVDETDGKPSLTRYRVLERAEETTRVAFFPLTGRTHQLRVHAAHPLGLNAPILGDALYGRRSDRLYLHAERLCFTHPISGERLCVECQAPF